MHKQTSFLKSHWDHRFSHGGELRKKRGGRGARPLSPKDPLHLVFKINIRKFPRGLRHPAVYLQIKQTINRYRKRFYVKVEQCSVQRDHIHLLVRCPKRALYHHFFRVVAGQIAQKVTDTPQIWKSRPWTRVIKGYRAYDTVKNYIQLNEKEVTGKIPYSKKRLKGLTPEQLSDLWIH